MSNHQKYNLIFFCNLSRRACTQGRDLPPAVGLISKETEGYLEQELIRQQKLQITALEDLSNHSCKISKREKIRTSIPHA